MVFSTVRTREITMVAADYLWRYPIIRNLLQGLGAIPVKNKYSQKMAGENIQPGRNLGAVEAIAAVLRKRSCLCIFPEGTSHSESELKEFKTGFARAAFMAMSDDKTLNEVHIVPVGLNYDQRNKFRSSCYVEFGIPVVLAREQWMPRYEKDPHSTVHHVVELVKDRIKEITLVAPGTEHLQLAHLARKLCRAQGTRESQEEFITLTKTFIELLRRKDQGDKQMEKLYADLGAFQLALDVLGISLRDLGSRTTLYTTAMVTAITAPLSLPGAIFHGPLALLSRFVAARMSQGLEDQMAHYKVLTFIFFLPLYYAITLFVLWLSFGLTTTILIMAGLLFSVHLAIRSRPFAFSVEFTVSMLKRMLFDGSRLRQQRKVLSERVRKALEEYRVHNTR